MNLLTEENIKEFRELGFTKVNHFWSDSELSGIKSALEELVSAGKLNNVATDGDGLTHTLEDRNLQLCPLMPEHKIFDCLPYTDKVRQAVSSLLVRDPGVMCEDTPMRILIVVTSVGMLSTNNSKT